MSAKNNKKIQVQKKEPTRKGKKMSKIMFCNAPGCCQLQPPWVCGVKGKVDRPKHDPAAVIDKNGPKVNERRKRNTRPKIPNQPTG